MNQMKYILIDTNIFIYREGEHELSFEMKQLTKILLDSNQFKIRIHPLTIKELNRIRDDDVKKSCLSRAEIYDTIENPPLRPDSLLNILGPEKKPNDYIDNCILYSLVAGCVNYLITNDKEMIKKAEKLNVSDKVFDIVAAIEYFRSKEIVDVYSSVFLEYKPFYNIDINDSFFDSLKLDYLGFEQWFEKKKPVNKAYVSYKDDGLLGSFLSLKIENEDEDYSSFEKPFSPNKRVKVSTMKVDDTGKRIGENFIKIMVDYALENDINEIYITIYPKQIHLISLLEDYGFKYFTKKQTQDSLGNINDENIYLKIIGDSDGSFPTVNTNFASNYFVVPIRPKYHELLFADKEKNHQLNIFEQTGNVSCSNAIKKAYLSHKETKMISSGDVLFFYLSHTEKAITNVGVVDQVYTKTDFRSFDEFKSKVKKRTVYEDNILKDYYDNSFTLILFKHYFSLPDYISYELLLTKGIVNGVPQSIQHIDCSVVGCILDNSNINSLLISNK